MSKEQNIENRGQNQSTALDKLERLYKQVHIRCKRQSHREFAKNIRAESQTGEK